MKLVVGLGNPGKEYLHSRHNVGFRCIDHMARKWGIKLAERRAKAVLGQGQVLDAPIVLAKPRTYMNNSGIAVTYLLARFRAVPADLVVIYDDMDLPPGKLRIRPSGSAAGHNGVQSIIDSLSSQEFPRVRVGIGKLPQDVEGFEYVLGPFTHEERALIDNAVNTLPMVVDCLLQAGIEEAMSRYN